MSRSLPVCRLCLEFNLEESMTRKLYEQYYGRGPWATGAPVVLPSGDTSFIHILELPPECLFKRVVVVSTGTVVDGAVTPFGADTEPSFSVDIFNQYDLINQTTEDLARIMPTMNSSDGVVFWATHDYGYAGSNMEGTPAQRTRRFCMRILVDGSIRDDVEFEIAVTVEPTQA